MSAQLESAPTRTIVDYERPRVSRGAVITGWILSVVPCLLLLFSAAMKFARPPAVLEGTTKLGWPDRLALALGILELACTVLYLIPRTAVLGAILLTGYLGGATATHVRIGDPFVMTVVLGVVLWLGLYLREPRLRALLPLRTKS
jgi:hypothetical protein